jgi:hypothetical protein
MGEIFEYPGVRLAANVREVELNSGEEAGRGTEEEDEEEEEEEEEEAGEAAGASGGCKTPR